MLKYKNLGPTSQIKDSQISTFTIEHVEICVTKVDGHYFAFENLCPHQNLPLDKGFIEGINVFCPWHGAGFNLKTGDVTFPPAQCGLRVLHLRIINNEIEVLP